MTRESDETIDPRVPIWTPEQLTARLSDGATRLRSWALRRLRWRGLDAATAPPGLGAALDGLGLESGEEVAAALELLEACHPWLEARRCVRRIVERSGEDANMRARARFLDPDSEVGGIARDLIEAQAQGMTPELWAWARRDPERCRGLVAWADESGRRDGVLRDLAMCCLSREALEARWLGEGAVGEEDARPVEGLYLRADLYQIVEDSRAEAEDTAPEDRRLTRHIEGLAERLRRCAPEALIRVNRLAGSGQGAALLEAYEALVARDVAAGRGPGLEDADSPASWRVALTRLGARPDAPRWLAKLTPLLVTQMTLELLSDALVSGGEAVGLADLAFAWGASRSAQSLARIADAARARWADAGPEARAGFYEGLGEAMGGLRPAAVAAALALVDGLEDASRPRALRAWSAALGQRFGVVIHGLEPAFFEALAAHPELLFEAARDPAPDATLLLLDAMVRSGARRASVWITARLEALLSQGELQDEATWGALEALGDPTTLDAVEAQWRPGEERIAQVVARLSALQEPPRALGQAVQADVDAAAARHDSIGSQARRLVSAGHSLEALPALLRDMRSERPIDPSIRVGARCLDCGRLSHHEVPNAHFTGEVGDEDDWDGVYIPRVLTCAYCGAADRYTLSTHGRLTILLHHLLSRPLIEQLAASGQALDPRALPPGAVFLEKQSLLDGTLIKRPTQAIERLEGLARARPRDAGRLRDLGDFLILVGERARAIEAWRRALEVDDAELGAALALSAHAPEPQRARWMGEALTRFTRGPQGLTRERVERARLLSNALLERHAARGPDEARGVLRLVGRFPEAASSRVDPEAPAGEGLIRLDMTTAWAGLLSILASAELTALELLPEAGSGLEGAGPTALEQLAVRLEDAPVEARPAPKPPRSLARRGRRAGKKKKKKRR